MNMGSDCLASFSTHHILHCTYTDACSTLHMCFAKSSPQHLILEHQMSLCSVSPASVCYVSWMWASACKIFPHMRKKIQKKEYMFVLFCAKHTL